VSADQVVETAAVGAVGLLGLVLLAVSKSPRLGSATLVGGSGALMAVQVSGVHAFTFAVALWLVFTRPVDRWPWLPVLCLMSAAGLLATTVLFGELVNSATLGLQLLAMAGASALIALRASAEEAVAMMRAALVVITAGGAVGLLQVAGIVPIDTWHPEISALGRPMGIWPEPDWLGLMAAVGLILAWRLEMSPTIRTIALTVNAAAVVLAFARAAWVGLALTMATALVAGLLSRRKADAARGGRRQALVVLLERVS
jgi:hypothetical protein